MNTSKASIISVLAICAIGSYIGSSSRGADPTLPSGDAQLEKRLAALEAENKALATRITALEKSLATAASAPATAPATTGLPATGAPVEIVNIYDLANKMPPEFEALPTDTSIVYEAKRQKRMAWVQENVAGKTASIAIIVGNVNLKGEILGSLSKPKPVKGFIPVWNVRCVPSPEYAAKAAGLKRGDLITAVGRIETHKGDDSFPFSPVRVVLLSSCTIK